MVSVSGRLVFRLATQNPEIEVVGQRSPRLDYISIYG